MRRLAIYDMDRTITRSPTWTPFLWHWARENAPWRLAFAPAALVLAIAYKLGLMSRGRLKERMHRLLIGRSVDAEALARATRRFADRVTTAGVLSQALERITRDRAEGWELVLATASYRFYVTDIAAALGFDHVIATDSVYAADGRLEARIAGENCYGAGKLRMVEAWMAREGLARADVRVRFYSDHVTDAPVFGWADEPFAVNAHGPLRTLARARGWPMLDW
ncbi:MAG: HAD-IB family hydrolase, partial [Staphylococcus hominis]